MLFRSRLFNALADETRLRIVALLSHGELCVCHLEEALGLLAENKIGDTRIGKIMTRMATFKTFLFMGIRGILQNAT